LPCFLLLWACPVVTLTLFQSLTGSSLRKPGHARHMGKISEQEVAVLSSKQGLVYLTANDWALLIDKASRVHFKKGAALMTVGKKADGVYLLLKASAHVQMPHRPGMRSIGPGEVCGEMSFLEDAPASASVVADGELEAYHLDRATLESLFELFPHLASRFYRSVATNLSRRLRELIGPIMETPGAGKGSSRA